MKIITSDYYPLLQQRLYRFAADALEKGTELKIIVPSQATVLIEKELISHLGGNGLLNIEVTSFEALIDDLSQTEGGRAYDVLDTGSFSMLVKLAISRLKDSIKVLNADDPSLQMELAELIYSMKSEGITKEDLGNIMEDSLESSRRKLEDIALISEKVDELYTKRILDKFAFEDLVMEKAVKKGSLKGKKIILFGFDVISKRRMGTICSLDIITDDLTILFMSDEESHTFESARDTLERLRKKCLSKGLPYDEKKIKFDTLTGEISFLDRYLYTYPYEYYTGLVRRISISSTKDIRQEINMVADRILRITSEEGFRMEDMAILTGDLGVYSPVISDVFPNCGIPYFIQSKRSLADCSLYWYLKTLFELVRRKKWRKSDALQYIRSPFVTAQTDTLPLYTYIIEKGIGAYRLMVPFGDDVGLDLEEARKNVFGPVRALMDKIASGEKKINRLLKEFLINRGIQETLLKMVEDASREGLEKERRFFVQVWPALEELLDRSDMIGDLSIDEYVDAFMLGAESRNISVIPPTTDEVIVGDVSHTILSGKEVLFIVGVNEEVLPKVIGDSGLLSAFEVEEIRKKDPSFPKKPDLQDQKAQLLKNLSLGRRLCFSYNEQLGLPSHLIDRIKTLYPCLEEKRYEENVIHNRKAALPALATELRDLAYYGMATTGISSAYLYEGHREMASLITEMERDNSEPFLESDVSRMLYGRPVATVSRIEEYYSCPFRYFVDYGLKPKEIQKFSEEPADIGDYIHSLLEEFTTVTGKITKNWDDLDDRYIEGTLKHISQQLIKNHNRGVLMDPRFSFTEKRLREEASYAIKAIRDQLKGTSVRIESEEKDFGGNILTIDTSEGRMTVRGRIDRIDTMTGAEGEEYLRVIDYKTSEKDFDLFDVLFGVNIQLVVYLMAAISFYRAGGREMTPAGGFYFSVKLPYVDATVKDIEGTRLDDYRMKGFMLASDDALSSMDAGEGKIISIYMQRKALEPDPDTGAPVGERALSSEEMETVFAYVRKLLKQAATSMYGGRVSPDPFFDGEKVSCEHCDYRSICRFDPEEARRGGSRKTIGKQEIIRAMKDSLGAGEEAEV